MNRVNAAIRRGRTVPMNGYEWAWSRVEADGSFAIDDLAIDTRWGSWFLVYDGTDGASAVVGPLDIGRDDREVEVEIPVLEHGSIEGMVEHVPEAMAGQIWVVLFDDGVVRRETLASPDGAFRFDRLPPGRYGLKAGHDGSKDPHVPSLDRENPDPTLWQKPAEPWQGAVIVAVEPGETAERVVVDARPPGPIVEPKEPEPEEKP
ncbi:carboxypeptidase-like regulatory domain-containing protein [Tautonia rosea]|uniref:carboxypeptidase-like regulatory domain-containing protein n=1 Tax=Tautonia rosea TaxID=2728037 RepID=UPI001473735D|nr:carboxypeptidase-like regulatory domain-containing protein [Tautonia rosea]